MATRASNTVGDHGDPADGDAGNQGIKKPHRCPAHPQGLTDDHELQFQSTETSRAPTDGNDGDQRIKKLQCRPTVPQGLTDDNELPFQPIEPSSLTGETWTIILQRYGATTADTEFVELVCDRSYITLANLVLLKTKLGYSMRDFMYYLKRCGNDSASLILLDYDHQTESMMAANEVERKLRLLISTEQPSELMKSITPMKRPRGTTTKSRIDVPTAEEPIDAYKEWLEILQQEQLEMEFRDDYRDETIETYKEWLRRKGYLRDICKIYSPALLFIYKYIVTTMCKL
ncbi:uncharacterized protein LOC120639140 [Panicum virgatum]|uniref:uncharacterized protein LOC120639140 n=1 Tax=Panicum virgatum TaxID=38727 RepID=UPI0019D5AF7B|nr:uncharacterized protein LOC120639140 [Panicum virgatum]